MSFLDDVPDVFEVVAGAVAGLLVGLVGVHRLALVGPLARTVVAHDDRVCTGGLVAGGGHRGRPQRGAAAVAGALAAACHVLVEGVERHALGVDQRAVGELGRRVGSHSAGEWCREGSRCTAEDEVAPFIASDGKTIYFSTSGFPGYGENDIFKSTRLDDTWQYWSEPENLGPAINTPYWDAYFTIPASGDYAYICSMNASKKEDIYKLELPKTAKPEPVAIISGDILTTTDKKPVEAVLTMTPQNDKLKPEVKKYDPATGSFSFVVPLKEVYNFVPYAKGYLAIGELVDLSKEISYREIKKDFYLMPLEVGNKGVLNSFTFEQGESHLQAPALKDLDRIAQAMNDFPTLEILFEGHTDNQGDFQLNLKLSEERVEEVKNYLISKGIASDRVTTKGWGQTRPIASNATEERRRLNRRVEFTITKK